MNTLRVLYHLARADFLERVRRYSFLLMLGLVVWIGYLSASGKFTIIVPPGYFGIVNSAWVGAVMTLTVSTTLGMVGFYLVKGSVSRDYTTGVGQIMATTPLRRPLYMLGKWLSNFAVMGITIIIMLIEGIVMNLLADAKGFDLAALAAPLVFIAIPSVGLVAAVAVLFESISWLRGALGNIIYFFAFIALETASFIAGMLIAPRTAFTTYTDFSGLHIFSDSISRVAQAVYPDAMGGIRFGPPGTDATKFFLWNGVPWTADILLSRLIFLAIAVGLVILAALFFDRFNPSHPLVIARAKTLPDASRSVSTGDAKPVANVRLTPLSGARGHVRFGALLIVELKLFLKGQRWWWYVVAAVLVIAPLVTELEQTRNLLLVAWIWPVLILSGLGCRENRFDTRQIVFTAPHPIGNQLRAAWLSALLVIAALGSGALIKFILLGEISSVLGWLTGVVFIPSLGLALGTLTGSGKAFEALYVAWLYMLYQRMSVLDFAGLTPDSPYYYYALLALVLLASSALARQRQLTAKRISK